MGEEIEKPGTIHVDLVATTGGWSKETSTVAYAAVSALVPDGDTDRPRMELPVSLKRPSAVLEAMVDSGGDYGAR